MRILHLLDEPWDSGITAYAIQTADLLKNAGHDVVLGILSGKKPERLAQQKNLPTQPINTIAQLRTLYRSGWDVINVHTGRSHTWMVLFNFFSRKKIPIVRTRGDARLVSGNPLSRFVYRRTAAAIAASDHVAKQYEEEFGFNEENLETIYPSVTPQKNAVAADPLRVGILGRLDPVKGHSIFLEAAATVLKEIPQARFAVAGKEAGVSISILKNQANQLEIQNAVEFLGFQESAAAFMASCSVGVIASIGSEEVSRACLEWLAAGRPVVGTLVGSIPELIETGENGFLVSPNDGAALGQAILSLLKDSKLRDTFGRNALQSVELHFGPDKHLYKTLEIYRKAMERA